MSDTLIKVGSAELLCEWSYTRGHPGRGPSYSDGGIPPDPPEFVVNRVCLKHFPGDDPKAAFMLVDITDLVDNLGAFDKLDELVLEHLGGYEALDPKENYPDPDRDDDRTDDDPPVWP